MASMEMKKVCARRKKKRKNGENEEDETKKKMKKFVEMHTAQHRVQTTDRDVK